MTNTVMVDNSNMLVEKTCPFCGEKNALLVKAIAYGTWQNGALVQDAFPALSPAEREFLITGMCEKCQGEIFEEETKKIPLLKKRA